MLQLFNTLSRQIEKFTPQKKTVSLYTCGPTVYHDVHLGNHRTFLTSDLLKRVLRDQKFTVKHVMNITDVGHLVGDGDAGQDKMELGAAREHKTAAAIAAFYTRRFKKEITALNIWPPTIWSPASKHIAEQIHLIKKLEQRGFTYRTADGIYFDSSKFPNYGALAQLRPTALQAGARIHMGEKKHPTDFALWKFSPTKQKRQMEWPSPWGKGFPGWHIECSAMAMRYFGPTLDLHVGGTDLIPVHHTNEIAQAEAATGKKFVRYWLHSAFVLESGHKFSKSTGEFKTLKWLTENGFEPLDYRYLVLQTHYRKELHFSPAALGAARTARRTLWRLAAYAPKTGRPIVPVINAVRAAVADDLNFPAALGELWKMFTAKHTPADARATLLAVDELFGLNWKKARPVVLPAAVKKLVAQRARARQNKNWPEADRLRQAITTAGFETQDTSTGQIVLPVI